MPGRRGQVALPPARSRGARGDRADRQQGRLAIGAGTTAVTVWDVAKWPVLLIVVIAVLYYAAPNARLRGFKSIMPGALLAVVIWLIASAGFAYYVASFGSYNKTYGALGAVIVLFVWLWITNVAILLGAEVNAERERSRQLRDGTPGAERELQLQERSVPKRKSGHAPPDVVTNQPFTFSLPAPGPPARPGRAAGSPDLPSQFPSHSPAPPASAMGRRVGPSLAAYGREPGRESADLESVLDKVWRVRISNPQLVVTEVRAPRVMLEGCPNNSQDPAMPNACRNRQQQLSAVSIFAAQQPIGCGQLGCLQDGCSACSLHSALLPNRALVLKVAPLRGHSTRRHRARRRGRPPDIGHAASDSSRDGTWPVSPWLRSDPRSCYVAASENGRL